MGGVDFRHRRLQISIHALREEGDSILIALFSVCVISIHALREEGDNAPASLVNFLFLFLSTPSARRATSFQRYGNPYTENFYPRPPRGGRPLGTSLAGLPEVFLSTPSARRATRLFDGLSEPFYISIHALREEGDFRPDAGGKREYRFLSTPSARRATLQPAAPGTCLCISIHALREEGDRLCFPMRSIF